MARVGSVPIYAQQVKARAAQSGIPVPNALQELISLHALAERARAKSRLDDGDPEVQSILVQRFLEREFETVARPQDVPEQDLRRIYDGARDRFVHPRLVEIAVLELNVRAKAPPSEREQQKKWARDLLTRVAASPDQSLQGFQAIADEPTWKARGLQRAHVVQWPDKPFSAHVGQAAATLKAPGDITGIIEDDSGFYIARYVGEVPASQITFEQTRQELLDGYYHHWRAQRFLEFAKKTTEAHRVEMHPGHLGSSSGTKGS